MGRILRVGVRICRATGVGYGQVFWALIFPIHGPVIQVVASLLIVGIVMRGEIILPAAMIPATTKPIQ